MPAILDTILVKDLVGSRGNTSGSYNLETINSSGTSDVSVDVSGTEDNILISMVYQNGVSNDVSFVIQGSADNINFADIADTSLSALDDSGNITWDLNGIRPNFIKLKWTVLSGSVDIQATLYGRRRH